jgi:phosphatidylserine/phosphatidylglycerophosphate/cardiolipin synthase-like enzyme
MARLILTLTIFFSATFLNTVHAQLFEDFETGEKASYAAASVTLPSGSWYFDDALIGTLDNDKKIGGRSARIRNGSITMEFDKPGGAGEISFHYASFGSDTGGDILVYISDDGGGTWDQIGEVSTTSSLQLAVIPANTPGNVRIRLTFPAGSASPNNRVNIDDLRISDVDETSEEPTLALDIGGLRYENGDTLDFGVVVTGNEKTAGIRIRNLGMETLQIDNGILDGAGFTSDVNLSGINLELFESLEFDIMFSPDQENEYDGTLALESNDPDVPLFILFLRGITPAYAEPTSIADARELPQGTIVTVAGWITVADQFRGPVYFQDETAGIAWFNNDIMRNVWNIDARIGDSLVITGQLGNFNNLIQIIDEISYTIFPESNREMEPEIITTTELNTGNYESQLVRINDVNISGSGTFSGGTNYIITDMAGTSEMRVDAFSNIGGMNIPNDAVNLTGVAGRFQSFMQILPRFTDDIEITGGGPVITSAAPYETYATPGSITLSWDTGEPGHSEVRYGLTDSYELGYVMDENMKTNHTLTIGGLEPATIYRVQLRSAIGQDTSTTSSYITSTTSPAGTTGEISVWFNKSTDPSLATYRVAEGGENFSTRLMEFIDGAEESAEFAFYSISGSVGNLVADKIIEAHQRGVDVRVIASGHTGNPNTVINKLSNAGVKATLSTGEEQHHNKFAVIDAHHEDPTRTWLITSSWNATDDGTNNQYQNMVTIQDVAIARAYLQEFNQLWGADSGNFNASNARFSEMKEIVNPSVFWIGEENVQVRLYFSPQGSTESQISRALATAMSTIDLNLNLITRRSLSNTMLSRFNDGVKVRGVIGEITVQGSEWEYLNSWADVHHFAQSQFGGILHHKYAIIDGENTTENSKVITGSHNWSANANIRNDENTLIIYDARIANEYLQEFAARYHQAGGQDVFVAVNLAEESSGIPNSVTLSQNYPNPFNPVTNIRFELDSERTITLQVYDIMGRMVATLADNRSLSTGVHTIPFDASGLSSGVYLYRLQIDNGQTFSRKMMFVK